VPPEFGRWTVGSLREPAVEKNGTRRYLADSELDAPWVRLHASLICAPTNRHSMAEPDRKRIAEEFARWARREVGPTLVRVVLFGSVARGEDRPGSDIDVLLEVEGNPVPVRRRIGPRIMEIAATEGVFVSAFVQSRPPGPRGDRYGIYKVIDREGRVLA
jgi:predicted nucleotidyltransferase